MTEQEQQLIAQLFESLRQQASAPKDAQADAYVRQLAAQLPDNAYLLAQRSLLLEQALQQAQQQIAQSQHQLQSLAQGQVQGNGPNAAGGSFLSPGLDTRFGRGSDNGSAAPPEFGTYAGTPAGTPPSRPASGQAPGWRERWFGAPAMAQAQPQPASGAGSGFLGQAAASAAGVAGGMLLFNGLSQLWGHQGTTHSAADTASQASVSDGSAGLDQLAQQAGRDHVGQAPQGWLDDSADTGDNSSQSGDYADDGSGLFDDDFA